MPTSQRLILFLTVAFVAVATLTTRPAHALRTIYDTVSEESILAASDMSFRGEVRSKVARFVGTGRMIATDYVIEVHEVFDDPTSLFGGSQPGDLVTLTFGGGTIGDESVVFSDVPTLDLGDAAIFLVQKENLGSFSPVVGGSRGLYRVRDDGDGARVFRWDGLPVTESFYRNTVDPAGVRLRDFASDLRNSVDRARNDVDLQMQFDARVPADVADQVFSGDQIPFVAPANGSATRGNHQNPREQKEDSAQHPTPEETVLLEENVIHEHVERDHGEDWYRFLWAIPDIPSIFNIPPIYYSGALWGPNFEYSLSDWNRYGTNVFRIFVEGENTFGQNDRNDFAFTSDASFQSVYGFTPSSGWLGIAVMFNSSGGNIQPGQKIIESDVILNVSRSWTLDFATGYNNTNIWYFRSTTVHEVGHCIGREHQFTENLNAQWHSVMNYPPSGAIDTEYFTTYMDDAQSIRAAYPANAATIADLGIYLYRTNGNGSSSPVPVVWSGFPSSVTQGNSFTVSNYAVENLGTSSQPVSIDWWLTSLNNSYSGSNYYLGTTNYSNLGTYSYYNLSSTVNVSCSVPPGSYYISAILDSDGFSTNNTTWSNQRITVLSRPTPSSPSLVSPASGSSCLSTSTCLDWNTSANATSYEVQIGTSCGSGTIYSTSSSIYCLSSLQPGVTYYWRVRGKNSCGTAGSWSGCRSFTTAPTVPGAPAQIAPASGSTCQPTSVYVDWASVSGASAYQVQLGTSCGSGTLYTTTATGRTFSGLAANTTFSWRVRARNSCGTYGAWTACRTFRTSPPATAAISGADQRYSLLVLPDGTGNPFTQAQAWNGVVGDPPTSIDGSLVVQLAAGTCGPLAGVSASRIELRPSTGIFDSCFGVHPEYTTDSSGVTKFVSPVAGGGYTDPGGVMRLHLDGSPVGPNLPISFNSPDINGDLLVDIRDVAIFASDLAGPYDYRSDFIWDGVINILDVGRFATAVGVGCGPSKADLARESSEEPEVAKAVKTVGTLGLYFDREGTRRVTSLDAGEPVLAHVLLRGRAAQRGIRAWEARLETSSNVRVLDWMMPEGALDVGRDGEHLVGLPTAARANDGDPVWLATVRLTVENTDPAELRLVAADLRSASTDAPAVVLEGDAGEVGPLEVDGAGTATAMINGDGALAQAPFVFEGLNLRNAPNPFNPATTIHFALPEAARAEVRIFDVSGRLVRRLDAGTVGAGEHAVHWNGRDGGNGPVASGLYFYQLFTDGSPRGTAVKMSLLK